MELEIENNGTVQATDGRIIAISDIRISSAANQDFIVGAAATASSAITITDDYVTPYITEANDIRIRIPSGFNMTWLTSGTSAVISGTASAKVSTTVSYEDGGKTLVINVTSNFAAGDSITVSGLSYTNFTAASYGDHLELEVDNDGTAVAEDDKYIAVGGRPTDPSMLAYGEGTVTTPRYRTWSGSAFSAEASANATDSTIKWTVLKSSPVANEVILGVFSSSSSRLYIQTWNSSGWTSSWNTTLSYSGDSRVFDIAYERSTGDAVVVFGHSTNKDLRYRKRVGGVWDGSDQIISAITPDDMPYWVRAEPHPTSDDIFVAINTNANSLYALRWNGASNTWDNGLKTTAGVNDKSTEGFDLAFEGASGNAFLVWGDASNNVKYRKFTTSWQAESTAYSGLADKVLWLVADYDRRSTSSDIAIGMLLNDGYLEFGAWNGSSWASRPTRIRGRDNTQRGIDVQFQKTTGTAIYAFCQFANPARMAWRTWSSSGGFGSVTVAEGDSGNLNLIQLKASPASNEMMAVYTDANADLFHRYYNGSIWSGLTTALETTVSDADKKEPFMFAWKLLPPTAVDLISFTAAGQKEGVAVAWETAQEAQNKGFNLYRAEAARGAYVKLNDGLIPATSLSGEGKRYEFSDAGAVRGRIYYYKLEDVDVSGAVSVHGPVCVDWDADGLPDDWEIAHGLNPAVNDADLDSDGDGLVNRLEYERGTDPFNPDTDGDGVPDGGEQKSPGVGVGVGADRGLHILSADSRGVTLELVTKSFDANSLVTAAGQEYERLRIPGYVHGYTLESGAPQVPLKGVLLDIPAGKIASLKVLDTQSRVLSGYRLYPAPRHQVREDNRVVEVFTLDEAAYRANAFYPYSDAELSTEYVYRGQTMQRLILHPLRFNPATGELLLHERMRVRVDFSDHAFAQGYGGQVRSAAAASHHAPAAVTAWAVPAGAAYKIITNGEGIYRITRDWLTAQGLEPAEIDAIDLSRVQLFNQGSEQTLHVVDDNGNNRLDAGDSIILYAAAVPAAYAKYAKHNVYWLVNGGSGSPLRMEMVDGTPAAGPLAVSHEFTLHHEQDQTYLQSAVGSDEMDRWIFSSIAAGTGFAGGGGAKSFTLPLPGTLSTGDLTIRMYSPYNMDHAAAVSLNGTALDSAAWSGIGSTEAQFAGVSLLDGNNTVSVTCQSGADKIAFDWYEVSYARDFEAAGDSLKFTHASGHRYQIGGFSTQDAVLYDISDPAAVKRVVGGTYSGSAPYILEVEPHGAAGAKTYLSVAPAALKTPVSVVKDSASSLADSGNAADWILITHRSLGWDSGGIEQSWVSSLVSLRQSQGLRTQVVDVQDIFDEFAWGLVSPQAIKDFLNHAFTNWQSPPPQYVLLAGDTSYDYKDNWNLGTVNYVPGYLIYTEHLGETISDDWLVQVSGADAVPDMYIGRLPANSVQQAADMAAKIVSYETAANTKRWEKKLLLVADNAADSWESVFETMNEDLAALLPSGLPAPERYYLGEYENESLAVSDLTADLLGTINSGALMLAYSGHGSLNIWATERILDNRGGAYRSDVTELANRGMYPFVVNLSCLTGYFIYPSAGAYASPAWLSLAEGFLRPADKGAVAALMPAGMTSTDGQHILSNALTEEIFTHDRRILGAAVAAAKQTLLANGGGDYEEVANTFLFFGDPATSLKVPLPRRPVGLTAQQQGAAVALAWNAALDCNGRAVAGYNLYRRASTEESYSRLNSTPITALSYTDTVTAALTAGEIFYYVVSAVDADGDESVKSEPAVANFSPAIGDDGGGGGGDGGATGGEGGDGGGTGGGGEASGAGAGGGGGCFISSATLCRGLDMWICALAITLICSFSLAKRATAAQRSAPREKSAALEEHPVRS